MQQQRTHERGATLIEAMAASGIFMFGVLGLLPMFYGSVEGVMSASRLTQATALAESHLDSLMRLDYGSALLSDGEHSESKNLNPDGTLAATDAGAKDGLYHRTWNVDPEDYNATFVGDDYKFITVRVAWWDPTAKPGRWRSVSLVGGKALLK